MLLNEWLPAYFSQWSTHPRFDDLRMVKNLSSVCNDIFILVSPVLLKQLLDNLVSNALKYSNAGSRVTIVATQRGEEIEIAVQDQGTAFRQKIKR